MADPKIAQKAPINKTLKAGKYWWCACGESKGQPTCDGSHKGGEFLPLQFEIAEEKEYWLCACKNTKTPPFCDGTHTKI